MYIVARIDGRNFTKLTKEKHAFQAPFDEKFRDMMVETAKHLMCCGFNMIYGFTESDEISLLFHLHENTFGRKTRKLISILAGEASAKFSSMLGDVAAFDCRISELPNALLVEDYFRWRNEDAHRNALNAHCYWNLRRDGLNKNEATKQIEGLNVSMKNELLHTFGINFNDLPNWQKRGIGIYWENVKSTGVNPLSNETVEVVRRQLTVDMELPMGDAYNRYIAELIQKNEDL